MTDVYKWPTRTPTADEMIRYTLSAGLSASAVAVDVHRTFTDAAADLAYQILVSQRIICAHDTYLLLTALAEVAPERADELAAQMWHAAEAGDSYGEWLYQWAVEAGLDAEAICRRAKASLPEDVTEEH